MGWLLPLLAAGLCFLFDGGSWYLLVGCGVRRSVLECWVWVSLVLALAADELEPLGASELLDSDVVVGGYVVNRV